MKTIEIPDFQSKKELFNFLSTNKSKLIAQKKSITKEVDSYCFYMKQDSNKKESVSKNENAISLDESLEVLNVGAVINTTNVMDSHSDVHINGLWDKSISENKSIMHVQEHQTNRFSKIISDGSDLVVSTKMFNWTDLGAHFSGQTQALFFDSTVRKNRNPFMFNQYKNKWVKNHSVGMRYVKIFLCINNEGFDGEYEEEYEKWVKYIDLVVNKEEAEEQGYFWAVTEAKIVEGSAVPVGSNRITPTINVEAEKTLQQSKEAAKSTSLSDFYNIINNKI